MCMSLPEHPEDFANVEILVLEKHAIGHLLIPKKTEWLRIFLRTQTTKK